MSDAAINLPSPLQQAFAVSRARLWRITSLCMVLLLMAALAGLASGAVAMSPQRVIAALLDAPLVASDRAVILHIRLPRLALSLLCGAALAVSGAIMQGLFRNPLADPGLVGVSSGAALAAALCLVLVSPAVSALALPLAAFSGGLVATTLLYRLATRDGLTSVALMLLAGIALNALTGAITGYLSFISDDRQLRDLTFWTLGSLAGATWTKVLMAAPLILLCLAFACTVARHLDSLTFGEDEAFHMGVPVERVKRLAVLLVAAAVGASVAVAGPIGFVGLVVPHVLRLLVGPTHRTLLPLAALLGGALLTLADVLARKLAAPAELPIGLVTAFVGAPFFLGLLLNRRGAVT